MAAPITYMTPGTAPQSQSEQSIKPTLLTFHGSGSNGTVHTVQLARLSRLLKPHFDIVSLEGPFPSAAGPGVLPFFEGCGPFKRWLPPHEKIDVEGIKRGDASSNMSPEVESLVKSTVTKIRSDGGRVAGLIGFSQGTRVVAGLLKGTEIRRAVSTNEEDWCDFGFALSVCDSHPPPMIPGSVREVLEKSGLGDEERERLLTEKIRLPSLHVLGEKDEWKWTGKMLIEQSYHVEKGMTEVREMDMGHHYPVIAEETELVKDWVMETYEKTRDVEK
ncbi:hypothetical protein EJ04DRAFT_541153 [Polyplosphaeria fusca]|uniref:Serine hydrolase domain-containing protein n=1 Tax=Polyplosphaeria fusca TaxID=682080 RepID=A0A9P4R609_9PLEO|nr:hypothetical protein EJ04DRAFT_541153 [Polyplosphaeria fusca]